MNASLRIETNQNEDFFFDVFDDWILLMLYGINYVFCVLGCIGLYFVAWFERSGQAGQFRILVNQLVSYNLDQVHKKKVFPTPLGFQIYVWFQGIIYALSTTIETSRAFFGAFPKPVCLANILIKNVAFSNACLISATITAVKFSFVYVFRCVPVLDDKFLSKFFIICFYMISILAGLTRTFLPGKPIMNEVNIVL